MMMTKAVQIMIQAVSPLFATGAGVAGATGAALAAAAAGAVTAGLASSAAKAGEETAIVNEPKAKAVALAASRRLIQCVIFNLA
jgi:hypothetical protein